MTLKINSGIFPSVHIHILMQIHIRRDGHPASSLKALIQHLQFYPELVIMLMSHFLWWLLCLRDKGVMSDALHQDCLGSHLPLFLLDSVTLFVDSHQHSVFLKLPFYIRLLTSMVHWLLPFPTCVCFMMHRFRENEVLCELHPCSQAVDPSRATL